MYFFKFRYQTEHSLSEVNSTVVYHTKDAVLSFLKTRQKDPNCHLEITDGALCFFMAHEALALRSYSSSIGWGSTVRFWILVACNERVSQLCWGWLDGLITWHLKFNGKEVRFGVGINLHPETKAMVVLVASSPSPSPYWRGINISLRLAPL